MNATRRLSIAALVVACLHLVFGAIVRISGSGMGCGDNWPKCYGYWFPPFSRPDLVVEVSHRYLASILTLTVLSMALVAFRNRHEAGIGGRGGAMRSAFGAVGAVFTAAILGGVTVKMGNAPWATVAHWLVAMTLLAMVATTAIRTGALGGASSRAQRGTARAKRSAFAAAVMAIFAVALGGLTAKLPGAAVGCTTVPLCGANPAVETSSVAVQMIHRTIALVLVLHLFGVVMMVRKRRADEAPVVVRAAHVALGMVLLQLVVASSMILFHLPPVLRSLHEATGVGIWLACFVLAYLARRAANVQPAEPAIVMPPAPIAPIVPPSVPPAPVAGHDRDETPMIVPPVPVFEASAAVVDVVEEIEAVEAFDAEELDWAPKSARASMEEELDEFSLAALEADVRAEEERRAAEHLAAEPDRHSERSEESFVTVVEVAVAGVTEAAVAEVAEPVSAMPAVTSSPTLTEDPSVASLHRDDNEASISRADYEASPSGADNEASLAPADNETSLPRTDNNPPIERVAGDSSVVAPPVEAPKLSPLPAHTMAVLVARGADML